MGQHEFAVAVGAFDEMLGADGLVGAHWQPVLAGLEALTHQQRLERMERINLRVRESTIAALTERARREGHTLKQVVCLALAEAGVSVAAADLEDRTPRRRR
jgi:hypothetical protein